ncbi:MAG TPA: M28 family peptidase [Candidatus Wujingus californicus]|uniref:M28 family peptidase n=1 Tax=Candidatus Wujingus californicus TaxID=3367618 RepID=UPI004024BCB7
MKRILSIVFVSVLSLFSQLNWGVYDAYANGKDEGQFLTNIRQLTNQGKSAGEGYFSQDGKYLIFQSEREPENPFYQIYMMNIESGETHRVSPGTGKTTCSFFRANSDEVLFSSTHLDLEAKAKQHAEFAFRSLGKKRRFTWDYDENYDIFSSKRDRLGLKRLTDAYGYDAEGAYSPDGAKIVFCSLRNAYPIEALSPEDQKRMQTNTAYFGEIYIMNADGTDQKRLTNWRGYDGGPFFSPDGTQIIWRHFNEDGMLADIYTMKLDGTDIHRLTDFNSMSWAPYYHPSGKYVIFHSNKYGFANCELFIVDVHGEKEPVRVTCNEIFDGLPVFSPDGQRLVWTSGRTSTGESQLFMADWNHEAALEALRASQLRLSYQPSQSFSFPESTNQIMSEKGVVRPFSSEINVSDLKAEVQYLASDKLEGRMTGSKGTQMAANYIVEYFKEIGLKPSGNNGTYFQEFPFISGVKILHDKNCLQITKKGNEDVELKFEVNKDFIPLGFTTNGEAEGQVVFAGYGLSVPGNEGKLYDSYAGLDVKDKIVVALHYVPEKVDMKRRMELNRYAGLRYKAMLARERGAKALLVIVGPNSPGPGELLQISSDVTYADSGIIVASITNKIADVLFANSGKSLGSIQSGLDVEDSKVAGCFELPWVRVKVSTAIEQIREKDHNVLGLLPPIEGAEKTEYVMIGAHYDHIGHGGVDSLARKGEEGQIHNGADDNASGVSTVMELAASLAEERKKNPQLFRRGIIFGLWSGEELGCLGSSYFAEHPTVQLKDITAYLNYDMVGRLKDNNLTVEGLGSSSIWTKMFEKCNLTFKFNLRLLQDPYQPTDITSLYPKGIPVIHFFTGVHEDYNRPTDDSETLNYEGMLRIAEFSKSMVIDLLGSSERPDYIKVAQSDEQSLKKSTRRAYWGTIPDFTVEGIEGVKLSSVKGGGPADKAGIKDGDIIIEIAGQKIKNVYDYNYAIDTLGFGKSIEVAVLRNGKREAITIVPEARK